MTFYRIPCLLITRSQLQYNCFNRFGYRWSSTSSKEPLRILFCGSDEFSAASLNALHAEHLRAPQTIESIEVVCRPGKRVGRGLKEIREVPIKHAATKLGLRIHEIDTFTGWTLPNTPIDLIIAVSFGLFVPSRLLNAAKYGGLNVHPSLLPDLRGPAPLYHTLLRGKTHTGITLQTLHHKHFDHGVILDQTPAPGFRIPNPENCTVSELEGIAASEGAEMLVKGIRNQVYVSPLKDAGWRAATGSSDFAHASKITPEDRHVDWQNWTLSDIRRRQRVLGRLWNKALVLSRSPDGNSAIFQHKRIILEDIEEASDRISESRRLALLPGVPFVCGSLSDEPSCSVKSLYVYTSDGHLLRLRKVKVEGGKISDGFTAALKARMLSQNAICLENAEFSLSHNPLT
ncbi:methionyl-tRNA formyltransferase family protein [Talaromyces proteolyticus]|uniref:methionyl-tRNA formyltransferase n=1 Tax=Talaromyces proteolyticus TaxID=1131652 RepID=A0AAD4KS43_9EURO|nr:methionyl-tRNA formyltransferase family protein [Talaromyces proteolyticus]KAH8697167.1 methionyl-tRNA formyltransferase family protein [Talaromyces proteolyticus]